MDIDFNKIAKNKTAKIKKLIHDALIILDSVNVPLNNLTPRRLERMAMCFLALCGMKRTMKWEKALSIADDHILKSREIIDYLNSYFEEKISRGSYDDIRRKDLKRLTGMGLVIKSANNPNADTNDGTRGYALEQKFSELIQKFKSSGWNDCLNSFAVDQDYINQFYGVRQKNKLKVDIEKGVVISLDNGAHNLIQKAVIEKFLPLYGYEAKVLYVGDTSRKHLYEYSDAMIKLGLNINNRGMLPDIVAFSEGKQWVYLIEAVHSSNPLNPERCIELQRTILNKCPYGVVFVTAFLSKKEFSKWLPQIAWETEVWLVDTPEHLIHFNGDRFLGPHLKPPLL